MSIGLCILLVVFAVLLLLNAPVAIVIGVSTVMAAWALGHDAVIMTLVREMANGLDSYPLLAIPFFVLAGDLMGSGGLAKRLIDLAAPSWGVFAGGSHSSIR
jgi:TRAP-type mannitol/chloroaromatic compound transport system permease large subunit